MSLSIAGIASCKSQRPRMTSLLTALTDHVAGVVDTLGMFGGESGARLAFAIFGGRCMIRTLIVLSRRSKTLHMRSHDVHILSY
jgi:hypothetical protein